MKKISTFVVSAAIVTAAHFAFASGFSLMEMTARSNAMGNSLVGSTRDASSAYFNPANMGENTNATLMVGASLLRPRHDVKVNGVKDSPMDSGLFTIPHVFITIPLPADFTLGLAEYSEYGIGTKFKKSWPLNYTSTKTTVEQVTLSPTLAYQVTDDFSLAAGFRGSWLKFESYSTPYGFYPSVIPASGYRSKVKGDDWGYGYLLAAQYRIFDNLRAGLVYRSQIRHTLKGDFDLMGAGQHSTARGDVTLPDSITFGLNYDITDKWRVGGMATWTRWSTMKCLNIEMPDLKSNSKSVFRWKDAWRFGVGTEYDLLSWMSVRAGYQFDMDPSDSHHTSTMTESGHRHIIGTGLGFKLPGNFTLDVAYSCIHQLSDTREFYNSYSRKYDSQKCYKGYTHVASVTLGYTF